MRILHSDPLAYTQWSSKGLPGVKPKQLNNVQIEAIELALDKPFQLIQGPPGRRDDIVKLQVAIIA